MEIDGHTGDRRATVDDAEVASGRARAVLDGMLRSGDAAVSQHRWMRAIAVLVLAAAVLVVLAFRRPAPIDERLPIAASESASESASVSSTSVASSSGAGSPEEAGPPSAASDGTVVVHVVGAVASPGVVALSAGSRVVDAVTAAGGLRADADPDRVNLAAPIEDGQRVVVPAVGQEPPAEVAAAPVGASAGAAGTPGGSPIDLNRATAQELESLPGVGPATAAAIISHREAEGPFRSVEDLLDVRGIGEAKLESMRDLVVVGS